MDLSRIPDKELLAELKRRGLMDKEWWKLSELAALGYPRRRVWEYAHSEAGRRAVAPRKNDQGMLLINKKKLDYDMRLGLV